MAPRLGGILREFLPFIMQLYDPAGMARVRTVTVDLLLDGSLVGFDQPETQD